MLNIASSDQLQTHFLRGALFENFVLNEIIKSYYNRGKEHPLSFWRDNKGKEVDCLIDGSDQVRSVEIKSGETMTISYFNGLHYWNKLSGHSNDQSYVVYAGEKSMSLSAGNLLSWRDMDQLYYYTNLNIKCRINKLNYFLFELGKKYKHSRSYGSIF